MKNSKDIILPELLCPAGDLTRLKTAVDFGADAVYIAADLFQIGFILPILFFQLPDQPCGLPPGSLQRL